MINKPCEKVCIILRRLQGTIPIAQIHIDRPHANPGSLGRVNQLRGRIKPHGLTINQSGGERCRIVVLQPTRNVDQQGKTGGMTLRKTVFTKSTNLLKHLQRKGFAQSLFLHSLHQLLSKSLNHSRLSPSTHRPSKLIRLPRGEARCHHGQTHRLLLKNGDSQSFVQHVTDLIVGIVDLFFACPTPEVRMNHVSLNRSRTDNRHFNHQIVVAPWTQSWQHAHLGSTFNLKDPHRVGVADHVINRCVFLGYFCQAQMSPMVLLHHMKTLSYGRQHSQAQAIHL